MNIPTKQECFELITKMDMLDHIIDHSVMVSNVALTLCKLLEKTSPNLNRKLVASAALLHDITKTRSFETNEIHSETGGEILTELGYPEVGSIIRQHVLLDVYDINSPVTVEEIVNYADKRVLHDTIVSLDKRLEYIKVRYGAIPQLKDRVKFMSMKSKELEEKIFTSIDIEPEQLSKKIELKIKRG